MIINAKSIMPTFRCGRRLADYLIYKHNLSVLDVDMEYFYFFQDENLDMILKKLPLWIKILNKF